MQLPHRSVNSDRLGLRFGITSVDLCGGVKHFYLHQVHG
jgi:hypothetical protein